MKHTNRGASDHKARGQEANGTEAPHEHKHDHTCDGHGHDHDHDHGNEGHGHDEGHSHDDGHDHGHHHGHGHHGHDHHHGPGHHHHGPNNKAGLTIAFGITSAIMLLEFAGGLLTNSLALLSDSGHMLSDAAALLLSLTALWMAARPATARRSFGYYRFEILAALFNGAALFFIAGIIIWEAAGRFLSPPEVQSGSMMLIALIGLLANLVSAWFLMRKGDVKDNINVRSAYLHVLGDALGSVGAIVAGLLMYFYSWYAADPIISVVVALLILKSAWGVIKWALHILMEGTPPAVDAEQVKSALLTIEGVQDVHDLHIWTITSGMDSLSCHLRVLDAADEQRVLQQAINRISKQFRIDHTAIQIEKSGIAHPACKI
ncbi:cation diffusion facilitator family transporter [Paenibacillus methanolicus]|uniref:Cobalt-zinc-cadmium efflux system protein n=1 Tax=Paenibacillus methanolicus TaxID=582686 RepID=A0A5S5C3L3_9BACL|nr:cation diffusion facilitator family transporter [Paenibacillus methanolicus]TYP74011.1 cobalt-zinc-cadmium efflux system protein [Paenibacillus methanolicus]